MLNNEYRTGENMTKRKIPALIIFVCSLAAFVISFGLFWNGCLYVDEANASPSAICGGEFWLFMDWFRLALLFTATIVSGVKLGVKEA
jgi:hypothetical protein